MPGTIYLNKNRYWWKVKLPGEETASARPLKPTGAQYATKDYGAAVEVARNLLHQALFENADSRIDPNDRTVMAIAKAYRDHAANYYLDVAGNETSEVKRIEYATKTMIKLYATCPAEEFGPLKLKEVRKTMIEARLARNTIHDRIACIKRMFRWAASEELAPVSVYQGLSTIEGLKRGRSGAKETARVPAVPEGYVYAILPHTTPVMAAMIELQLLTGMRSTELCIMRPCDLETSGEIWFYRPAIYKTQYLDRETEKVICIGPRGQEIIRPYLKRRLEEFLFSPAESERIRKDFDKNTTLNERYDRRTYRKAVQYAIKKANKARKEEAEAAGTRPKLIPMWTPHQLRHTATTRAAKEFGIEVAKAATGHANISTTQIYAERDLEAARKVARKFG
jgi:integrase